MLIAHPAALEVIGAIAVVIVMLTQTELQASVMDILFAFAASAEHVNWGFALSQLMAKLPTPDLTEFAQAISPGPIVSTAGLAVLALFVLGPFIALTVWLVFLMMPSDREETTFGAPPVRDPIKAKNKDGSSPYAGYAALMEKSPEQKAAQKAKRQAEVKARYRERILKKPV